MRSFSTTLLAIVLTLAMAVSYGNALPTPIAGSAEGVALVARDASAAITTKDETRSEGTAGLRSRDLAQILAYAAQSMQNGPNVELGTLGIIVENNPNGRHFPASAP